MLIVEKRALGFRGAAIGHRVYALLVDEDGDRVAGHLVGGIPARADRDSAPRRGRNALSPRGFAS